jgi:hypothetical protein
MISYVSVIKLSQNLSGFGRLRGAKGFQLRKKVKVYGKSSILKNKQTQQN